MQTLELVKSIEAKKLNKRSKLPLPEPPVTIPFGALVQSMEPDGASVRFSYLGELYLCPAERLLGALPKGAGLPEELEGQDPAQAQQPGEPQTPPAFLWTEIRTSQSALWRAKVPGGWFVMTGPPNARTLAFYPDPAHAWDGTTLN